MPQTQKIQLAPITAWTLVKWFLIPGLILAYITLYPPHALDIALSEPFYNGTKFALNRIPVMVWIHRLFRIVPFFIRFSALFVIIQNLRNKVPPYKLGEVGNRRALYMILGMLASVFLVKFLKDTTGVYCPYAVEVFSGNAPLLSPVLSFHKNPGHCWPSGFTGTAFCCFAMYFAFRDVRPRLARGSLIFTWLFGIACSVIQVMRGEHFMSHTLATALFDWLTCALLYCVFFSKEIWQQFIVKNRAEDGGSTGGPMLREAVAPVRIEDRENR